MDNKEITAPTLDELMDKLDAATPPNKIAEVIENGLLSEGGEWKVTFRLKDRII